MKAVVFEAQGDIDQLKYMDVPEPKAGPNDVVIKVRASACNHNDIWARRGMPGMDVIVPHISGSDVAGEVVEVGSEVSTAKVGDEVLVHSGLSCRACEACTAGQEFFCRQFKIWGFQTGPLDGGHAEYCRVPAVNALPKPKNLTWEEAASLPLVLVTVWRMLVTRARARVGDFVLVWGAAGGLGSMAVQVCKLVGARPIAVAASDEKLELAKKLGAEFTINRKTQDIRAEIGRITSRRGVDIVFEHTGQETWPQSVLNLKWGGTLVVCGATSGHEGMTDIRYLWMKQMNFLGSHLGSKAELVDALRFVESGQLKPVIHEVMPLKEAARAQTIMENDELMGKLILVP